MARFWPNLALGGNFPLWLSPVQVKIIPVRENHNESAKEIYDILKEHGIRAELDDADANLGSKVRDAKNNKIPYWIVLGDKEIEAKKMFPIHFGVYRQSAETLEHSYLLFLKQKKEGWFAYLVVLENVI